MFSSIYFLNVVKFYSIYFLNVVKFYSIHFLHISIFFSIHGAVKISAVPETNGVRFLGDADESEEASSGITKVKSS